MSRLTTVAILAAVGLLASHPVLASVVVGMRVFPVTLTLDDPGVGDEMKLPQVVWQRDAGPQNEYQLKWEWDKTITPTTSVIYDQGYDWLQHSGSKTRTGFENVFVTGKWQAYTNVEHEFVVSLGVIREFGGNTATQNIGGDAYGSTAPVAYFGKGLNELPIPALRPLAVTGQLSYGFPDRPLNSALDNGGTPRSWNAGLSVQYSIPYLQSQVHDFGLPEFIGALIPVVETTWYSPAAGPAGGFPATLTVAPGVIYFGDSFQVGIEALIPANRAAGNNVGAVVQLFFFFDDLFPDSFIGKPIFE